MGDIISSIGNLGKNPAGDASDMAYLQSQQSNALQWQMYQDAASRQTDMFNKQYDMSWQQYNDAQQRSAPWLTAGTKAINQLSQEMSHKGSLRNTSFTGKDFLANKDPGYGWRMQQGTDALNSAGAAAGNFGSGNMGTALQNYGQNQASAEYGAAYDRFNNSQNTLFNRLSGVAGTGQVAANNLSSAGMNTAQSTGQAGMATAASIGGMGMNAANYMGNMGYQGMSDMANAMYNGTQQRSNQNMSAYGSGGNLLSSLLGYGMKNWGGGGGSSGMGYTPTDMGEYNLLGNGEAMAWGY